MADVALALAHQDGSYFVFTKETTVKHAKRLAVQSQAFNERACRVVLVSIEELPDSAVTAMNERLYIEQLRSTIGDLIAAGKARRGFKTLWELRVTDAKKLLERQMPTDSAGDGNATT